MSKIFELRGLIFAKYSNEADCARQMGWDRRRLNKITSGSKNPDITELSELSSALGVSIESLAYIFLRHKSPIGQRSCARTTNQAGQ